MSELQDTGVVAVAPPKPRVFSHKNEAGVWPLLKDLGGGLLRWRIWFNFAGEEIRNRFHGSLLGVAWFAVSFLVFVVAIALYFRALQGHDLLYVAFGMAVYQYVVSSIGDGCNVFVSASGWIQGAQLPYSVYIYKSLSRSLLPLLIHLVLCGCMFVYAWYETGVLPGSAAWESLGAFVLLLLNAIWVHYVFGLVNARFRDLQHLVSAITRLLFFTTPILWTYEETGGVRRMIADLNPITHFVQIFRGPLIGDPISDLHWYVAGGITIGGWLLMMIIGGIARDRLPIWLD